MKSDGIQLKTRRRQMIWIVDDSATDAERARRLLAVDYEVTVLNDGATALERLAAGLIPDLLLLDWIMPGMTGIEVCQYVRSAQGKLPQVPILLLTTRYGAQEISEAFSSGANDYVAKPFVEEELRARVEALLTARQLLERAEDAEADLRSLLMNAPDPIFAVDTLGQISFANEDGLRILGKAKHEVIGQTFAALVPGINLTAARFKNETPFVSAPDVQIADKVFSPSLRVLPSGQGEIATIALRDVTERRSADARRLDFYSIITHDLRTPITSVLLRLDLAFRGKHGELPAGHIADLRRIETSLRAQVALINDFLDLARLEGTGRKLDRSPVNLTDLIRDVMEEALPMLEKKTWSGPPGAWIYPPWFRATARG